MSAAEIVATPVRRTGAPAGRRVHWGQRIHDRLWLSLRRDAPRGEAYGIELRAYGMPAAMAPLFFARVHRALALIERHDARRLARIRRDVALITGIAAGPSHYHHSARAVVLSVPTLRAQTVLHMAMTIVHEATHGRICNLGVEYMEPLRDRIERICVQEEAAFARRLIGGEPHAEAALRKLETPWWTPAMLHDFAVERLRADETPELIVRWADWVGRRRLRRQARRPPPA